MVWLIIGIILSFIGGCNVILAILDHNSTSALGGALIALLFFILGIPMVVKGVKNMGSGKDLSSTSDLIDCPFCAEKIKAKANVCRYCGKNLSI